MQNQPPAATLTIESQELRRSRPRDVEALHAVQATRPLKPPRYDFEAVRVSPATIEARADRKRGIL